MEGPEVVVTVFGASEEGMGGVERRTERMWGCRRHGRWGEEGRQTQTGGEREAERAREADRERDRQTEKERDRDRRRGREGQTDRNRDGESERERRGGGGTYSN